MRFEPSDEFIRTLSEMPMKRHQRRKSSQFVPNAMSFIGTFLTSKEVFGQRMEADFLLDRIRSYGWKPTITRLAQLSAYIQHPSRTSEEIRARTVDPILRLTGDSRAAPLLNRAKAFISANRVYMNIAHDEVLLYLQHTCLVEGDDNDESPADEEIALWMLGVNCYLGEWAEPEDEPLTDDDRLIAYIIRGHCFNKRPDWAALAVRSYELFRHCPESDSLGGDEAWPQLQLETFGSNFERYYSLLLAPLLSVVWRAGQSWSDQPVVSLEYWRKTGAEMSWIQGRLDAISLRREAARAQILSKEHARDSAGLLHAPSLLRRKPLLADDEGWLITSSAAIATLFHAGPWGAYLERFKSVYGNDKGFKRWSSAFGFAFERYCADLARRASDSGSFRSNWKLLLPPKSGTPDEIEDVVLLEDDHAVVFSIKSTMLPEDTVHRAKSCSAVLKWTDRFLFSEERSFKGAVRKLSANIDKIRRGEHGKRGVPQGVKIYPVLVTYDTLGEDVLLYRRIRRRCADLKLLSQNNVAPLTLASVSDYERLMQYLCSGRSLVGLLRKRKQNRLWFDRRIDQQISSLEDPVSRKEVQARFQEIFVKVLDAVQQDVELPPAAPVARL